MSTISLAAVARALDTMLDGQMTAQARIAAHLIAAEEAAGRDAARVVATLDAIAADTVIDEVWITDERGVVYLTNVRDEAGAPMPFEFYPDPAIQPQASAFHTLLSFPVDADGVVTQAAQVREIDHEVYKYVGVSGVDRRRIVQVGNALAFEEQASSQAYTSPVMTAVLAAFGEPDLLSSSHTNRLAEIRAVFEAILGRQMVVQAALVDAFVAGAEAAGWPVAEIDGRLRRIVRSSPTGEINVAAADGETIYASGATAPAGAASDDRAAGPPADEARGVAELPIAPRLSDGALYKYVKAASPRSDRVVRVGLPIDEGSLVSPPIRRGRRGLTVRTRRRGRGWAAGRSGVGAGGPG